jgi:branched-chain amino acid transport system substrate-binding protein
MTLDRRSMIKTAAAGAGSLGLLAVLNGQARAAGAPVPVGSALPLSGPAAADGIEFRNGLQLAAEEINAAGGVLGRPIELHIEDTQNMSADVVSQAMQRLIDQKNVGAIVNGYNVGTNLIEMEVAAQSDVIVIHYNTLIAHKDKFNSDPAKYYSAFQGDPPEFFYGPGVLNYLRGLAAAKVWTPPNNKIAVIPSANQYSVVIANAVRDQATKFGFEISLYETVPFPTNQWGPTLAKIRQDPPAAILVTHFLPQDLAQFMQQFITQPTQSLVYMQYGPSLPAFREIGGAAVDGVLYSTVIGCLPDEFSAEFRKKYREKYGPNSAYLTGSQTYDGLWQWALAAAIAGGPGEPYGKDQNRKVAAALQRLIYRGVNGICRFDPHGQVAMCYPTQVSDPSLGMPHQFLQHQDYRQDPKLVAPPIYATDSFKMPPWIK